MIFSIQIHTFIVIDISKTNNSNVDCFRMFRLCFTLSISSFLALESPSSRFSSSICLQVITVSNSSRKVVLHARHRVPSLSFKNFIFGSTRRKEMKLKSTFLSSLSTPHKGVELKLVRGRRIILAYACEGRAKIPPPSDFPPS